jgi:hypothetical protein
MESWGMYGKWAALPFSTVYTHWHNCEFTTLYTCLLDDGSCYNTANISQAVYNHFPCNKVLYYTILLTEVRLNWANTWPVECAWETRMKEVPILREQCKNTKCCSQSQLTPYCWSDPHFPQDSLMLRKSVDTSAASCIHCKVQFWLLTNTVLTPKNGILAVKRSMKTLSGLDS